MFIMLILIVQFIFCVQISELLCNVYLLFSCIFPSLWKEVASYWLKTIVYDIFVLRDVQSISTIVCLSADSYISMEMLAILFDSDIFSLRLIG